MNVTMCSSFRNAENYLDRYFEQVNQLDLLLCERGDSSHLVLGEGDSTDNTSHRLQRLSYWFNPTLINVSHGGPDYGHIVDAGRFKQLAGVWNRIWSQIPADADVVIMVESDLIWSADTIIALIDDLEHVPCVAPFVAELSTQGFYDCWGFRKNGKHFNKHEPYFDGWPTTELVPVDSAGSCLVMKAALARHLTWPEEDVIVGICNQIYRYGGSVHLDPACTVTHS